MNIKLITAQTAPEAEAHIEASDDGAIYEAIFGEDCVLDIGSKFAYELVSNNSIKLSDGALCIGGRIARLPHGLTENLTIENGTGGQKRNDLIVAKFSKAQSNSESDSIEIIVKKGEPSTGPVTDPALIQDNLYQGGSIREMPLYRIRLNGISVEAVEPLFAMNNPTSIKRGGTGATTVPQILNNLGINSAAEYGTRRPRPSRNSDSGELEGDIIFKIPPNYVYALTVHNIYETVAPKSISIFAEGLLRASNTQNDGQSSVSTSFIGLNSTDSLREAKFLYSTVPSESGTARIDYSFVLIKLGDK